MGQKLRKFIGILFLLGATICCIFSYHYWKQYKDGKQEYEKLSADYTTESAEKGVSEKINEDSDFQVNWEKLLAKNPDCVGWIRMAPSVSYPVVQGSSNKEYLHRGFNGSYNINGSIFMHADNRPDWTDKNTIVYGHNMNNGSMFGNNDRYKDINYAKNHPNFYIYTQEGKYTYRIFDTITTYDATYPYEITFHNDDDFGIYLKKMNDLKKYGLDTKVSTKDRIVTLSTCTFRGKKRFIIQGVLESFTDTHGKTFSVDELHKQEQPESQESSDTIELPS